MAKLRDEAKFDGLDALVAQMHLDAQQARRVLDLEQESASPRANCPPNAVKQQASA